MKTISKQAQLDGELVAVIQGDSTQREKSGAFNQLYENHKKQVLYCFLRGGLSVEGAEDALMIVFTKVHANIDSYEAERSVFSTWLHKIVENTLIDAMRKKNFEVIPLESLSYSTKEGNEGVNEFQLPSDSRTPEQEMIRDENIELVRSSIAKMDDGVRELMEMRFLQEKSFEEIAKELGVPDSSTLRVTIRRGKAKLVKIIEET